MQRFMLCVFNKRFGGLIFKLIKTCKGIIAKENGLSKIDQIDKKFIY